MSDEKCRGFEMFNLKCSLSNSSVIIFYFIFLCREAKHRVISLLPAFTHLPLLQISS